MNNSDAPEGMVFFCPIRYKSKIWRTTKLVAGTNGKFYKRFDNKWARDRFHDTTYLDKLSSDIECTLRNQRELLQAQRRMELEKKTVDNLTNVLMEAMK